MKRGTVDNTGRTSEIFNAVHDAVKYLENDVPDQAGDGNSWGSGSDYDGIKGYEENHGLHATGYFGKNSIGDSFTYKVTLDAGEYNITTGHTEWWSGNSRSTKVTASYIGTDGTVVKTELGSSWLYRGNPVEGTVRTVHLSVPENDTEVTLTFTAAERQRERQFPILPLKEAKRPSQSRPSIRLRWTPCQTKPSMS